MITAYNRGHKIYCEDMIWRYVDTNEIVDNKRRCAKCDFLPTEEGYDACIGYLKGASSACCGHGKEPAYIIYEQQWNKSE